MASIGEWLEQHWNEAGHAVAELVPHHDVRRAGEGGWFDTHHHAASAATATATPTITADTQEDPMNVLSELEQDARALAAKFGTVDKAALEKLDAVTANPEAAIVFEALAQIVHLPVAPGEISAVTGGLGTILRILQPQAAAEPQYAAGPQVAGQA